ncbi:MAG: hypothetical protein CVV49_11520 [Spirochaetae bacterium HGW-Spirochaetae-5]|nr:MAG: hypothetical protein CVV49_11520 [Spirochaetae bacterium HGW-Spirochaetae-5]
MIKKISAIILILSINVPLPARDIDLDAIYLKKDSALYRQITASKEKLYDRISSLFIDSNVIYAGWSGGDDIIYIKEFPRLNIVYKYIRSSRSRQEIARFSGTVTAAFLNKNGNFLYTKTLYYNDDAEAVSETLTINTGSGEVQSKRSGFLFLDFTLHPSGSGLVNQTAQGIFKTDSSTGSSRLVHSKDVLSGLSSAGDPVLAFISPDEKKTVLVSGNGGAYKTKIVTSSGEVSLNGVSSNTDLRWIDNSRFIYRSGGGGDYSVRVYNITSGKSMELISGTLNPDINFSEIPGLITCLDNQVITIISRDLKWRVVTGIEGEESYFSPDGRKFTSIYLGRLYVNSLNMVEKYRMDIRRNGEDLIKLYRKAAVTKSVWESDYSPEYINKKIKQYDSFLKMKEIKR